MTAADSITVAVQRLAHGRDLPLPAYQTDQAAGLDLSAALAEDEPLVLVSGARTLVPTGISLQIPSGCEGQIRPRSGLALRHGVTVLNAPGTIDADYRGEIQVLLINHGDQPFTIRRGDRIAQLVFATLARAVLTEAETLAGSARGTGGFGSTGPGKPRPRPSGSRP